MERVNTGVIAKLTSIHKGSREATATVLATGIACILSLDACQSEIETLQRNDLIIIGDTNWRKHPYPESIEGNMNLLFVKEVLDDWTLVEDANHMCQWLYLRDPSIQANTFIQYDTLTQRSTVLKHRSGNIDESANRYLYRSEENLTYSEFYGYSELVNSIKVFFDVNLRQRKKLSQFNTRPARGILFAGEPGVGKTFLGRIIASEFQIPFYLINGPSIISKWVGDSEKTLHNIFTDAAGSPNGAIVFIDEIDAIAPSRNSTSAQHDTRLVEQLLTEMDGFTSDNSTIVIASTNRAEALDPALKRPGRFDRIEYFPLPSASDRLDILTKKANTLPHKTLPIERIAACTDGFSAAELCAIFSEAVQLAIYHHRTEISEFDFIEGFNIVNKNHRRNKRT